MTLWRPVALIIVAALLAAPAQARPPSQVCQALAGRIAQSPAAAKDRLMQEALFEAAALDCPAIAQEMLARGASVEARNRRGATALSVAAGMVSADGHMAGEMTRRALRLALERAGG